MTIIVIGCGGIGGFLVQTIAQMLSKLDYLLLVDGDTFEASNMTRQMFCRPGTPKVEALTRSLKRRCKAQIRPFFEYLGAPQGELNDEVLEDVASDRVVSLFCGADNHKARLQTLNVADKLPESHAVLCANEETDAEAYYYKASWYSTPQDPRMYYPELLHSTAGDPLSPPCTGEIQDTKPQLALANMSAASYGMWLWYYWTNVAPLITDADAMGLSPVHVTSTAGRLNVKTLQDYSS